MTGLDGEVQVLTNGHVGKQRIILKNIAAASLLWRQVQLCGGIEIKLIVNQDATLVGMSEAGQAAQCEGFAGSARAQECSNAPFGVQMYVQGERTFPAFARQLFADARIDDRKRHGMR
jgi:hypothetical protein